MKEKIPKSPNLRAYPSSIKKLKKFAKEVSWKEYHADTLKRIIKERETINKFKKKKDEVLLDKIKEGLEDVKHGRVKKWKNNKEVNKK